MQLVYKSFDLHHYSDCAESFSKFLFCVSRYWIEAGFLIPTVILLKNKFKFCIFSYCTEILTCTPVDLIFTQLSVNFTVSTFFMYQFYLYFLGFLKFFISGSERSFLSSSNADESFFSENLNFSRDDQNASYNPDEISISDEENEFKEIMAAQREAQKSDSSDEKLASPLKNVNIDSESSSLNTSLRSSEDEIASPIKSIVSEGSKLASPNKSLQDSYELDELDPEFLEMIAAQKKHQDLKSGGHIEIAASNSDDEVEEILKEQKLKKSKGIPESASPTEELLDNKASTDKSSQKRNEGTECEESPQTKRLKRRNQQLYTESDS